MENLKRGEDEIDTIETFTDDIFNSLADDIIKSTSFSVSNPSAALIQPTTRKPVPHRPVASKPSKEPEEDDSSSTQSFGSDDDFAIPGLNPKPAPTSRRPSDKKNKRVEMPKLQTAASLLPKDKRPKSKPNPKPKKKTKEQEQSEALRIMLEGVVVTERPDITLDQVSGLEKAKQALREAVVLPIKLPHLFTGMRKPWRGILLYGPPGTGKSYLAKAVASEGSFTFLSCSASHLISKWQGESERLVRALFEMAREKAPAVIFLDEVDALCSARSDSESDGTRRIKTELLVQMQGVGTSMKGVLVLGATNLPQSLDPAVRRRFERRIYVGLPDLEAREGILRSNLPPVDFGLDEFARRTEGYSGSDLAVLSRDAMLAPLRELQLAKWFREGSEGWLPCLETDEGARETTLMDLLDQHVAEPPLRADHLLAALDRTRPSVGEQDLRLLEQFRAEFGSV